MSVNLNSKIYRMKKSNCRNNKKICETQFFSLRIFIDQWYSNTYLVYDAS